MIIGSETQNYQGQPRVTGVQRLVKETHTVLDDLCSVNNCDLHPMHTKAGVVSPFPHVNEYFAQDPILWKNTYQLSEVDAAIFLDLNTNIDFIKLHRERRYRHLPTIFFLHDLLPIKYPHNFIEGTRARFRNYLQSMLMVADHIVVSSETVSLDLKNLGWKIKPEVHVIPLGTSFKTTPPRPIPTDRISILYAATIEPRKGHVLAIEAYDHLRSLGHDVDMNFVGSNGWKCDSIVEKLINHPDYSHRLRWFPGVGDSELHSIANNCNIGIFPSEDEGFGFFIEEGLSRGLKMVVTDIPVFRERSQPNLYFSPGSSVAFANSILAAQNTDWKIDCQSPVRTMEDFANGLYELLRTTLL